jgi:hypothetical protein
VVLSAVKEYCIIGNRLQECLGNWNLGNGAREDSAE